MDVIQLLGALLTGGVAVKAIDVFAGRRAADVPVLAEMREWTRDANARADALAKRLDEAEAECAERIRSLERHVEALRRLVRDAGLALPADTPPHGTPAVGPDSGPRGGAT